MSGTEKLDMSVLISNFLKEGHIFKVTLTSIMTLGKNVVKRGGKIL